MFWKKPDFWTTIETKEAFDLFNGIKKVKVARPMCLDFELATREQVDDLEKVQTDLHKKVDLILEKLQVEYTPETGKKEPAKLVEKRKEIEIQLMYASDGLGEYNQPIKPKRKYTKRKKK